MYPASASCTKMCPPCTTSMYIKNVLKDIIHEMYPPYANMCIYQYANMCIYQHAKQCASINMLNKYHPSVYHHTSKHQAMYIVFFPRLYNIHAACCTTECMCTRPIQGQNVWTCDCHHCYLHVPW
jgi:hypothetical protein